MSLDFCMKWGIYNILMYNRPVTHLKESKKETEMDKEREENI